MEKERLIREEAERREAEERARLAAEEAARLEEEQRAAVAAKAPRGRGTGVSSGVRGVRGTRATATSAAARSIRGIPRAGMRARQRSFDLILIFTRHQPRRAHQQSLALDHLAPREAEAQAVDRDPHRLQVEDQVFREAYLGEVEPTSVCCA